MKRAHVYFFGGGRAESHGDMRELLGGKGAGLMEMTRIGLPVPAGFILTTEVCELYLSGGRRRLKAVEPEIRKNLTRLERLAGRRLGDPRDPLLVSVRSGAARSMPGMMETILNLGLNDRTVRGLAARPGSSPRFAFDAYRRFLQMYSAIVLGVPKAEIEGFLRETKNRLGVTLDTALPAEALEGLCRRLLSHVRDRTGRPFPQDPRQQLRGAIEAVFRSWTAEKAVTYRRVEGITGLRGTAVTVMQMVFGNLGETSGTGVCFTRDPNTGEKLLYGELLMNAQGEDVVAGTRTPMALSELGTRLPGAYRALERVRARLERHFRDMQDLEFTIEDGRLYMLQCRTGKRSPGAAFRLAVDMAREGLISREEAVARIAPPDLERLFHPIVDPALPRAELEAKLLAKGIGAVPGAAVGEAVLTAREAEARAAAGRRVILVRHETSPEDVGGMHAAQGVLTVTGGKTSHAAVVARGWGKPCVVGCETLVVDPEERLMRAGGRVIREGDRIALDGSTGQVYQGEVQLVQPDLPEAYRTLMAWADGMRVLRVRANADTPADARKALEMGAEGIGLCRTEHMFFESEERRSAIQEMIVAGTREAREKALARLLPFQRKDFEGIFEAMDGLPVTIRLIDPPLHEFLPHEAAAQRELAGRLGLYFEVVARRVEQLREANPMLGHRGCRLCLTYPEILEMQVRAIFEAAVAARGRGIRVLPEIMHPLTMDPRELVILVAGTRRVADQVMKLARARIPYLVGTMIEVPRAAILAGPMAREAEFFSFGTNDLTQMTMALSRDDAGRFLPEYVDERLLGVLKDDPFQTLDQEGVGVLVQWAIERGRAARPGLKIGICGEHGGDARSITFCHETRMDYVSCSPYRIPVARLAAAQAVIGERRETGRPRRSRATAPTAGRERAPLATESRADRHPVAQA
ncbi:MAG TPA: pyruvate, phosphate dikinase [Candidatus Polarisedimenticolia bacterium]|nr:pyruvate, phosphate dikinase [Candidatus Polarisedimenticolia bacterium]